MSEQLCQCSGAPGCGATGCPAYIPHLTHGTDHSRARECLSADGRLVQCEPVQMMICPDEKCPARKRCPSGEEHKPDRSCLSGVSVCPACVPVEQADPEPPAQSPPTLDEIRRAIETRLIGVVNDKVVLDLCDEIEQLRAKVAGVERARDQWLGATVGRGNIIKELHDRADGLRDKLRKRDAQIVGYHSVIRDIAISVGEPEGAWRKLGGKTIVGAVRALVAERDELRGRCENFLGIIEMYRTDVERRMTEAEVRIGEIEGVVSPMDNDDASVRYQCEGASQPLPDGGEAMCTALNCPLIEPHRWHINCGVLHYCHTHGGDIRCVEVAK